MQANEAGEATPEGQTPEPNRPLDALIEAVQGKFPETFENLLKKGPPQARLLLADFKARKLLGRMKLQPPPWLVYALSGLPYPMTWWKSDGRSQHSEQDPQPRRQGR